MEKVCKVSYLSPIGRLIILADQSGITKIEAIEKNRSLNPDGDQNSGPTWSSLRLKESLESTDNAHLQTCLRWLDQYFKDPTKLHLVENPVLNPKTYNDRSFVAKVWQVLRKGSKPGEHLSYKQLAEMVGNPKAARGVGQAMRKNPFPLVVPCHRVVRSDGDLGNYSMLDGAKTKKWLLDHEKKFKETLANEVSTQNGQ